MKIPSPRSTLMALVALLAITAANAQGGLTFGVSLNPLDMVANANITIPILETGEAQHAARADVSYAFRGLPALSATYLLRDTDADGIQTYLGAGAGVTFLAITNLQPLLTLHALAGGTVPITGGLGAYGEVVIGGNQLATNMRFALGLNYALGRN